MPLVNGAARARLGVIESGVDPAGSVIPARTSTGAAPPLVTVNARPHRAAHREEHRWRCVPVTVRFDVTGVHVTVAVFECTLVSPSVTVACTMSVPVVVPLRVNVACTRRRRSCRGRWRRRADRRAPRTDTPRPGCGALPRVAVTVNVALPFTGCDVVVGVRVATSGFSRR